MDKLKFIVFSIIALGLMGLIGYWSIISMHSGTELNANEKIDALQKENVDLNKQIADLIDKLDTAVSQLESATPVVTQNQPVPTPATPTTYKNQTLINALQKLVTSNVSLKLKSTGTRVGTIQTFLNVYNDTSNKIDNDYGASTAEAVSAFQKDQGLSSDGQIGVGTLNKMVAWLKKQG